MVVNTMIKIVDEMIKFVEVIADDEYSVQG